MPQILKAFYLKAQNSKTAKNADGTPKTYFHYVVDGTPEQLDLYRERCYKGIADWAHDPEYTGGKLSNLAGNPIYQDAVASIDNVVDLIIPDDETKQPYIDWDHQKRITSLAKQGLIQITTPTKVSRSVSTKVEETEELDGL